MVSHCRRNADTDTEHIDESLNLVDPKDGESLCKHGGDKWTCHVCDLCMTPTPPLLPPWTCNECRYCMYAQRECWKSKYPDFAQISDDEIAR